MQIELPWQILRLVIVYIPKVKVHSVGSAENKHLTNNILNNLLITNLKLNLKKTYIVTLLELILDIKAIEIVALRVTETFFGLSFNMTWIRLLYVDIWIQ